MIYLLVLILLLFSCSNYGLGKGKIDNLNYFFLFIVFIALAGLRFRVGGDTLAYMSAFESLPKLENLKDFSFSSAEFDPLWYVFNAIVKFIYDDFIFFQIVHAIIINTVVFWFIRKYSSYKYITLVFYYILYYFYFNFEVMRESLSICLFLISVPALMEKKWIKYYLLSFLAFLFHSSALILFLIPFLKREINFKYYVLCILLLLFFFVISSSSIFSSLSFVNFRLARKIELYTSLEINIFGSIMRLMVITPFIIFSYIRKRNFEKHKFEEILASYILIGFLSMTIGGFYRFMNYFSLIALIYIIDTGFTVYRNSNKRKYYELLGKTSLAFSIMLLFQFSYLTRDMSEFHKNARFYNIYIPYTSVFDPKIDVRRENIFYRSMGIDKW